MRYIAAYESLQSRGITEPTIRQVLNMLVHFAANLDAQELVLTNCTGMDKTEATLFLLRYEYVTRRVMLEAEPQHITFDCVIGGDEEETP